MRPRVPRPPAAASSELRADHLLSTAGPVTTAERIDSIDVLRGFALCGILLLNITAFAAPGQLWGIGTDLPTVDRVVYALLLLLVDAKFFTLFSFLFGLGFSVQMVRAQERGAPFTRLFLRRLAVLAMFGVAHVVLLWEGDILLLYAGVGVLLLAFRNASSTTLLRWVVGLLASVVVVVSLLLGASIVARHLDATAERVAAADEMIVASTAEAGVGQATGYRAQIVPRVMTYVYSVEVYATRIPTVLAMFLLGLYVGRRDILRHVDDHERLLRRVRTWGLLIGLSISLAVTVTVMFARPLTAVLALFYNQAIDGPLQSMGYAAALLLALRSPVVARRLRPLAAYGRMALTNYLGQSLLAYLIFTAGGLAGHLTLDRVELIAVGIICAQIAVSVVWLRHFRYGPLEWVWRSMTYGYAPPLRIVAPDRVTRPRPWA